MKRFFVFLVFFISSFGAFSQSWTNIFGRQRFATGLSIPVKDSTFFQGSADTAVIYINPSNTGIYYRYKTNHIRLGSGGGGGGGTVTSVGMTVPTGFSVSGSPITTAGTLGLSFASGYSLPTNANQANWTTAYNNRITSLTTTGNSGASTLISNVLNIPNYTLAGLGGITATFLSGTPPINYNSSTGAISISQATGSTNGFLSSTDWNTFNSKQNQLNGTGFVKASGTVISYDTTTYVPYVNATKNVNLGEYGLSSGFLKVDTTPTGTPTSQGTMYWDANEETVALIMNGTTQRIGQDLFYPVKNQTGSTIPKGTAVRFAGTVGASGRLLIAPFLANGTYPSKYYMGVTSEDIADGANGQVMSFGKIRKINTSAYVNGDILYPSTTTAGGFQTTPPVAPNNIISAAAVVYADATNGEILVRATLGSKLAEDESVLLSGLANNQVLTYESSTSLWKNKTIPTALGYTPAADTITISTTAPLTGGGNLTANRTISIPKSTALIDGYLDNLDWATFNAKQDTLKLTTTGNSGASTYNPTTETLNVPTYTLAGLGGISLTSLSATAPLAYNNTTGVFSISQATTSTNGYLSSTDWNTFNNKQGALTLTTTGTSGAATLIGNTLNIPNYATGGITGSGANGQMTFWTGTNTVSGDNGAFWDNTNKRFGLGTTTPTHILETAQDVKLNSVIVGVGGGTPPLNNIKVGTTNLNNNTTGTYNIAMGIGASAANTTGAYNINIGFGTGGGSANNNSNVFIGALVAGINSTSTNSVVIGNYAALEGAINSTVVGTGARANTKADSTTAVGYLAGSNSEGTNNMYFGYRAGYWAHGYNNILFGHDAAYSAAQKDIFNSIIIGYNAQPLASGNKNQIVIGNNATGLGSYTTTIGNDSTTIAAIRGNLLLGTTTNDNSALLNMVSTSKGLLKPRMTTTQRDAISSPATGLEIFNTTTGVPNYYNGSAWVATGTGSGTVTSVAALTLGTTGTDLSSTVANSTTTPVITLNVPTASATNRGALSAADWTTFNNKQAALSGTGFVKISGTTISYDNSTYLTTSSAASTYQPLLSLTSGYVPKATGTSTLGNSLIYDNGSGIGINTTSPAGRAIYAIHNTAATYATTIQQNNATGLGLQIYANLASWGADPFTISSNSGNIASINSTGAAYFASGIGIGTLDVPITNYNSVNIAGVTGTFYRAYTGATETFRITTTTTQQSLQSFKGGIRFDTESLSNAFVLSTAGVATFASQVTSNGNLYISKTTPQLFLNATGGINGTIYNTGGSIRFTDATGTTPPFIYDLTTGAATFSSSVTAGYYDGAIFRVLTSSTLRGGLGTGSWAFGDGTNDLTLYSENAIKFGAGATQKMILTSTGNLLIGTTTGVTGGGTLQVNGDVNISGTFKVNGTAIGTGGGGISGSGTANYLMKWSASTAATNSLIYDNGTNVTVGGTSSLYKLTVTPTSGVNFGVGVTNIGGTNNAVFINGANDSFTSIPVGLNGSVVVFSTGYTESARIDASQNWLIGSSSSLTGNGKLQITGDVNITGNYRINGTAILSGTANYLTKFSSSNITTNSIAYDDGTNLSIGSTASLYKLTVTPLSGINFGAGVTSYGGTNNAVSLNASDASFTRIPMTLSGSVLGFFTGFTEAGKIDASQNWTLGTSAVSGGGKLQVNGDVNITGNFKINGTTISSGIGGTGSANYLAVFGSSTTIASSSIYTYTGARTYLVIGGTVGGSSPISLDNYGEIIHDYSNLSSPYTANTFKYSGTGVGSITVSTTATAYNTSSDYRLKEDLKAIKGIELISKIKVYDYAWKSNGQRAYGVMAHELQEVVPTAVTGVKDGENMQSVDYSKLVPILVQAIKDQQKEIELLKSKIK